MKTKCLWSWVFPSLIIAAEIQSLPQLDTDYERAEAYHYLNTIRQATGLNTLSENRYLEKAARAHARYIVVNRDPSHFEKEGSEAFSGVMPQDRAAAAGYASRLVSENLSVRNSGAEHSVNGLLSAIYHRFGFLDPSIDEIGIGVAQPSSEPIRINAFVYVMGIKAVDGLCRQPEYTGSGSYVFDVCADKEKKLERNAFLRAKHTTAWLNPKIVVYPYAGQKNVSPAFYDETPDPLPDIEVSGFPVSIMFNPYYYDIVEMESFDIFDQKGRKLPARLMDAKNDPNGMFTPMQFALFPLERLEFDTTYRVEAVFNAAGKRKRIRWFFHTYKPNEPWFRIDKASSVIHTKGMKSFLIYFVPRSAHDRVVSVRHDPALYTHFVDYHTLRIVMPDDHKDYVLEAGGRKVTIKRH
jgi:hypothetical protein